MRKSQKIWTDKNRERVNAQALAWYYRNREKVLANKNREVERKRAADWASTHREAACEKTKRWRKNKPGHHNALTARSKARVREATCFCCQDEDSRVNFTVAYDIARRLKMHVDHVHPISKGGKHCLHNLQLLTPIDNLRKGAKWQEAA